jgi:tryptophan halogenase
MVDQLSEAQLGQFMGDVRGLIEKSVAGLPTHAEYIAHNCKAD